VQRPAALWCLDGAEAEPRLSVDAALAAALRPHQRDGIQFMYDCLTGARGPGGGCILADMMGLGKTIQALTLAATLGRARPLAARGWVEPVGLTAVVCPASLVKSWEAEVGKWPQVRAVLGGQRMHVVGASCKKDGTSEQKLRSFLRGPRHTSKLLVISYDQARRLSETLAAAPIDLLIADEGHRLKASAGNATIDALNSTSAKFRIVLSATPVQNNLLELWAMVNFVLPDGPLGSLTEFRCTYAEPIEVARTADAEANADAAAFGAERSSALAALLSPFTLRRDASVLRGFLPPRSEWLLFAQMPTEQRDAYDALAAGALAAANGSGVLGAIHQLCAACSHPQLVGAADDNEEALVLELDYDGGGGGAQVRAPAADAKSFSAAAADASTGEAFVLRSGKLALAEALLLRLLRGTDEKVVVVCRFLKTLALLDGVCARAGFESVRLDGSTAAANRQELVEVFNVCDQCRHDASFKASRARACAHGERGPRVFLLTARAGGLGLTIVGASRMLLLEPDWNPAIDVQAMGRIYREGQPRPTHIYRLFAVSSIDEKILQRQLTKRDVADCVIDGEAAPAGPQASEASSARFSRDELRELFAKHRPLRGTSETAELLESSLPASRRVLSEAAEADPVLSDLLAAAPAAPEDVAPTAKPAAAPLAHACSWDELEQMRRKSSEVA